MSEATEPTSSEWQRLRTDAARHATTHPDGLPAHAPKAALLTCADARVSPSRIFDREAGDLFTVRIAGNTAEPGAVASLEFAISALDVELIAVIGHTDCGAVAAAMSGGTDMGVLLDPIRAVAARHPHADARAVVGLNVAATMGALRAGSTLIDDAVRDGHLEIHGAVYDLATGELTTVDAPPADTTIDDTITNDRDINSKESS